MKFNISPTPNPHDSERPIKTPQLKIQLLGDNGAMLDDSVALVDSGANDSMVRADYALDLGIDLRKVEGYSIYGIGDEPVCAKPSRVKMRLLELKEEIEIPILFVFTPKVDVILGRCGFFDRYIIKFDLENNTFEITKSKR